jgi:hypothetical protein
MVSGETILKFTDYPFAYSIVAMILGMLGFSLTQNYFIFLGFAGALGTLLAIVDPIGMLIRWVETRHLKKHTTNEDNLIFKLSALKTKAISFEIEKIIGMFYFIFSILGFLFAVTLPTEFFDKLILKFQDGTPVLEELQMKTVYLMAAAIVMLILAIRAVRFWNDLDAKIDTTSYHLTVIDDDNATQVSIDGMSRAIEQNDWELAEFWGHKIENEIMNKKGKRELIIKAADSVFSPLHVEGSEFVNHLKTMNVTKQITDFKTPQWDNIKQKSLQSIVEDTDLRHRIENYYKMMGDFNELSRQVFPEMNIIIKRNFSESFHKDVSGVNFYLDSIDSSNNVHLQSCAMFEIHPLDFNSGQNRFGGFKLQTRQGNKAFYSDHTDRASFDNTWEKVLEDVKKSDVKIKITRYLTELEIENSKLMKIYSEKIGMQWDV